MDRIKRKWKWWAPLVVLFAIPVLMGSSCSDSKSTNNAQDHAIEQQNKNTDRLTTTQPTPDLNFSIDRAALIKRYERTSKQSFRQYIAVYSNQGQLIYTGVVKGKVTPLDSQLTPADGLQCRHFKGETPDGCGVVQIAEPNGTWGTNGGGVFWFDDKDIMHESGGFPYLVADQPFQTTSQPLLVISGQTTVGK